MTRSLRISSRRRNARNAPPPPVPALLARGLALDDLTRDTLWHRFAGRFRSFADRLRNFVRLAETDADRTVVIAGHDQSAEAESPAAFDHLGATIDEHHFLRRVPFLRRRLVGVAILSSACVLLCHELKF